MTKYVFISYAWVDNEPLPSVDQGWISTLADGLNTLLAQKLGRKDIVKGWLDKRNLPRNKPMTPELFNSVKNAAAIVIILSQGYLSSDWCKKERETFLQAHPGTKLFIVERENIEPEHKPQELKDYIGYCFWVQDKDSRYPRILGEPKPDTNDRLYYDTLNELAHDIAKELKQETCSIPQSDNKVNRDILPPICTLPDNNNIPYHTLGDLFVGRIRELWKLHDIFQSNERVCIISGTGGIGKTQFSIEYAYRFGGRYQGGMFWINADRDMINDSSQLLSISELDIDPTIKMKDSLPQLWKKLSRPRPVLIIFDNFPENEDIQEYLPTYSSIYTIITTRTRRHDLYRYPRLHIEYMTKEESIVFLNINKGFKRQFGKESEVLVDRLAGLPLALELTKYFLNLRVDMEIPSLLQEMDKLGEIKILDIFTQKYENELPSRHSKDIGATFKMSLDILSPPAKRILQAISLLEAVPVPRSLLGKICNISSECITDSLDDIISDELRTKSSLVDLDIDNDPYVHRLIACFVKTTIEENDDIYKKIVNVLKEEMITVKENDDAGKFYKLEKIVPHAKKISSSKLIKKQDAIYILNCLAEHHWKWGGDKRYELAENKLDHSLAIAKKQYGDTDKEVLQIQINQAIIYRDRGKYYQAKKLLCQTLQDAQRTFGKEHPIVVETQSILGLILRDLGKFKSAKIFLYKVLDSDLKNLKSDDPYIAMSQANLACALKDLGEFKHAKNLLEQAIKFTKNHNSKSPELSLYQTHLAMVLRHLGEFETAKKFLEESIAFDQKNFGTDDWRVAIKQSKLAMILRNLGEFNEAKNLLKHAIEVSEKHHNPKHVEIALKKSNLAQILQALGEFRESRLLFEESLEILKEKFEPKHPWINTRKFYLAMTLKNLGEFEHAKDLLFETLEADKKYFKFNHISIIRDQMGIALVLKDLGEFEKAKNFIEESLQSHEAIFGSDHYEFIVGQSNLALILKDLGYTEEAKIILYKAFDIVQARFEQNHLLIAMIKSNLATLLIDYGEYEEAKKIITDAINLYKKSFDEDHYLIAIGLTILADSQQNQFDNAEKLLKDALEFFKNRFDSDHPLITECQSKIAIFLQKAGKFKQAEYLLRRAFNADIKRFKPDHPLIAKRQANLGLILRDLGKYSKAKGLLRKSLKSSLKCFADPNHPLIAKRKHDLAVVLTDLGEIEEAKKLAKESYESFLHKYGAEDSRTKLVKSSWDIINCRGVFNPK